MATFCNCDIYKVTVRGKPGVCAACGLPPRDASGGRIHDGPSDRASDRPPVPVGDAPRVAGDAVTWKPVTITGRQWWELYKVVRNLSDRPTVAVVAFRPGDVVVTDGHRMFSFPLPHDPARNVSLAAEYLRPWAPAFKRLGDRDFRLEPTLSPGRVAIRFVDINGATSTEITMPVHRADLRIPDSALDKILVLTDETPASFTSAKYVAAVRKLHRAFGCRHMGVALRRPKQSEGVGENQAGSSIAMTFEAMDEKGDRSGKDCRYVIMGMANQEKSKGPTR